ncbi:MAG: hypothetical protein M3179_14325 [Actinomycetota bacterium]|nr:hypothetical protein [Actinomycetota bacterium]
MIALAGASAPASAKPEFVNGHFTLRPPAQSECPPNLPLGICMSGTVDGRVHGSFTFVPGDFNSSADSPTTLLTTGTAGVNAGGSTFECKHAGAIEIGRDGPRADGPFVSLCVITGGTGKWAGAQGYMRITGTFTLDQGGIGSYDGKLVLP